MMCWIAHGASGKLLVRGYHSFPSRGPVSIGEKVVRGGPQGADTAPTLDGNLTRYGASSIRIYADMGGENAST